MGSCTTRVSLTARNSELGAKTGHIVASVGVWCISNHLYPLPRVQRALAALIPGSDPHLVRAMLYWLWFGCIGGSGGRGSLLSPRPIQKYYLALGQLSVPPFPLSGPPVAAVANRSHRFALPYLPRILGTLSPLTTPTTLATPTPALEAPLSRSLP